MRRSIIRKAATSRKHPTITHLKRAAFQSGLVERNRKKANFSGGTSYAVFPRQTFSYSFPSLSSLWVPSPQPRKAATPALFAAAFRSTGAVIPNATVRLTNPNSGVDRTATTDPTGQFIFPNVSFNSYQVSVSASGFASMHQSVAIELGGGHQPQAGGAKSPALTPP